MPVNKKKLQIEIAWITNKAKELGIAGTDLLRIRNNIKKAQDAQDQAVATAALESAHDVLKAITNPKDPSLKYQAHYIGDKPVNLKDAKDHLNRRIDGVRGALQRSFDQGAQSMIAAMDQENAHNFTREFKSFHLFLNQIENTITTKMSENPKVYKILMKSLLEMLDKARFGFNKKFNLARRTHQWFGGSLANIKKMNELSQALITADKELEAAKLAELISKENAENLFVIVDEPEDEIAPVATTPDIAEPVAEDFGSKIKNIFREKFDKSYKKALKESLEK